MTSDHYRPLIRAGQGAILAFCAPLGWLGIRWLQGFEPETEIIQNIGLYFYMSFATVVVFFLFGWYVGNKERLVEVLALRDALTGLFNVRYFSLRLQEEVLAAKRYKTPLTLILFDLDHFKQVNDTYGHLMGDEVLSAVSEAADNILRKNEVLARVGGEEFAVLLPRCTKENAREIAERLRKEVAGVKVATNKVKNITVTISLGVAEIEDSDDADSLYNKTDIALYQAKDNGRNRVEVV